MSEKQAKQERREEAAATIPIAQLVFNLMPNHGVAVSGPIDSPVAVFEILGKGFICLAQHYAQKNPQNESEIVAADMGAIAALNAQRRAARN